MILVKDLEISEIKKIAVFFGLATNRYRTLEALVKRIDNEIRKADSTLRDIRSEIRKKEREEERAKTKRQKQMETARKWWIDNSERPCEKTKFFTQPYIWDGFRMVRGVYDRNTGAGAFESVINIAEEFDVQLIKTDNWGVYAKRIKYPCIDYTVQITLPKKGYFGLIDRHWVWLASDNPRGCKAAWIEQKRMNFWKVDGWCVKGHLIPLEKAKTLHEARLVVYNMYQETRMAEKPFRDAVRGKYTFDDSISAGNCKHGTEHFVQIHQLDKKCVYTGRFLLDIAHKDEIDYVRKMIEVRAKQMQKNHK